jgi:hypothetical protein
MDEQQPNNKSIEPNPKQAADDEEYDAASKLFDKSYDLISGRLPIPRDSLSNLRSLARFLNIPSDETLYHYTTDSGFQGIVEDGVFHATSAYFLNDSSEIDYGCQMFADVLSKRQKLGSGDSIGDLILNKLLNRFSDLTQMRHILAGIYVVCFCEQPNLLSQWRAYGQNGGYSIGFKSSGLKEFRADGTSTTITLEKVIYDEHTQKTRLEALLLGGMPELDEASIKEEFGDLHAWLFHVLTYVHIRNGVICSSRNCQI